MEKDRPIHKFIYSLLKLKIATNLDVEKQPNDAFHII